MLTAIAVATFVSAVQSGRSDLRRLALLLGLSVPAQALLGGVTVLTDLNPWVVSFHLLFSMGIISLAVLYLHRTSQTEASVVEERAPALRRAASASERSVETSVSKPHITLAWTTWAVAWVVLALGTVVTGSGPHAGDVNSPRNGLDPLQVSQLHADFVFLLVGLTVALVIVHPSRVTWTLLVVELAQGLIGFVQYFTDLPVVLVGFHLLGASLVAASVMWALVEVHRSNNHSHRQPGGGVPPKPGKNFAN